MKFNKDNIYSNKSFFWIPTYYDKQNDIFFCTPENKEFVSKFYEKKYWDNFSKRKNKKSKIRIFLDVIVKKLNIWNIMYISDFKLIKNYYNLKKWNKILENWIIYINIPNASNN